MPTFKITGDGDNYSVFDSDGKRVRTVRIETGFYKGKDLPEIQVPADHGEVQLEFHHDDATIRAPEGLTGLVRSTGDKTKKMTFDVTAGTHWTSEKGGESWGWSDGVPNGPIVIKIKP